MRQAGTLKLIQAATGKEIEQARLLLREYAETFNHHPCFRSFERELVDLPGDYAPPAGRLYLAYWDEELAGCIALRKLQEGICEMKRLYVKPDFRGRGIGKSLALRLIEDAKAMGYSSMCLDTLPVMQHAAALYHALGFEEIEPYYPEAIEGAICMELGLGIGEE